MDVSIEVRTSGLWQLNSVIITSQNNSVIVDPGYFPREIAEINALLTGRAQAVVFTHGHWDHVVGWQYFPEAEVWASKTLVADIAAGNTTALQEAAEFDARWYVQRPMKLQWPKKIRPLANEQILCGKTTMEFLSLPGHSPDSMIIFIPQAQTIIVGDYLSPCEIPFVDNLALYQSSLRQLLAILPQVVKIIPGHGPILSAEQAQKIAEEDLAYLDKLLELPRKDLSLPPEQIFPRAFGVPGMWEEHVKNYGKLI